MSAKKGNCKVANRVKICKISTMHEPSREADEIAHAVIGAAIEVHRKLGPGFLEAVYENALHVELSTLGIPFSPQHYFTIQYRNKCVGSGRIDLLVADRVIVELKCVTRFDPIHTAQVISYLKASGAEIGLLINFNIPVLKDGIKRIVLSNKSTP